MSSMWTKWRVGSELAALLQQVPIRHLPDPDKIRVVQEDVRTDRNLPPLLKMICFGSNDVLFREELLAEKLFIIAQTKAGAYV